MLTWRFSVVRDVLFCLVLWCLVPRNNSPLMLWWSVLLVEETGVPGENHRTVASHRQTLSHNVVSITSRHERGSSSQL